METESSTCPMPTAAPFSREFARLVWLLVYRPSHLDDQKRALRIALQGTREGGQRLNQSELAVTAARVSAVTPRPDEAPWITELATRMAAHSVRALDFHPKAKAGEVLGLARALAMQSKNDGGRAFDAEIVALAPTTLAVHLGRDGFVRTPTPPGGVRAVGLRPALTPPSGMPPVAATGAKTVEPALPNRVTNDRPRMITEAIMGATGERAASDLVMRLRGELTTEDAPILLDEIGRSIEESAKQGHWVSVVDMMVRLIEREASVTQPDIKRAFGVQLRRMGKPALIKGIAQLLPTRRDAREDAMRYLHRQGAPAADMLVDLLVSSESSAERRAYRDAIVQLPDAAEPLQHLLRDHRWFVVRNAADLLGQMNATGADQELINTLRHKDSRVRRAATFSLIRLGTPRALHTIVHALQDDDPTVRLMAAQGLSRVHNPRATQALLAALEGEHDQDIVVAILHSLGKHTSDEAVERLVKESSPGSLLKRRPMARRLAAITALGEHQSHVAQTALRRMVKDKDPNVRDLATRLLSAVGPATAAR